MTTVRFFVYLSKNDRCLCMDKDWGSNLKIDVRLGPYAIGYSDGVCGLAKIPEYVSFSGVITWVLADFKCVQVGHINNKNTQFA